jgi:tetratricopeptide (TPR) repeat protein
VVPQVWRELALVYASQAQVKDAQECIQHARSLDPYSADTFHAAGCVAEAAGDPGAAEEALQTALALNPAHAPSLLSKGEAGCGSCMQKHCACIGVLPVCREQEYAHTMSLQSSSRGHLPQSPVSGCITHPAG